MNKIMAIFILILIILLIVKIILIYIRDKRINDFAISSRELNGINNIFIRFILSFSRILRKLVIFNSIVKCYDKYINEDSLFKKNMDYLALSFISGFSLIIIYIIGSLLYFNNIIIWQVVIFFIIGFLIPNIYLLSKAKRKDKITENDITKVVIIMNNSFKVNRNSEQALKDAIARTDGLLKIELQKVLKDNKLGLSLADSFFRMKKRLKMPIIDEIINAFNLHEIANISYQDIFDSVESKMVSQAKVRDEIKQLKKFNIISYIFFTLFPLVLMIILVLINEDFYNLITSNKGWIIIVSEIVLYINYLLIIMFIEKGHKYE